MLYRSEVHLASLGSYPGESVEIDDADADRYEVEALVEGGFLTPLASRPDPDAE